jgi:acyl-coenzyme A thioesterase PaaI-like protein
MRMPGVRSLAKGDGNLVRRSWDHLSCLPGGTRLFSKLVGHAATSTGTISAHIVELGLGYATATMKDHKAIRNHLHCVHAVALINLAELTGSLALAYALPDDARFIVTGLDVEYLKKARGTIRALTKCPIPETSARTEYVFPIILENQLREPVARAQLRALVSKKMMRAGAYA